MYRGKVANSAGTIIADATQAPVCISIEETEPSEYVEENEVTIPNRPLTSDEVKQIINELRAQNMFLGTASIDTSGMDQDDLNQACSDRWNQGTGFVVIDDRGDGKTSTRIICAKERS